MLATSHARPLIAASTPSSVRDRVSARLRHDGLADATSTSNLSIEIGRALSMATLDAAERATMQHDMLEDLLHAPPALTEFSLSKGVAALGFVLHDLGHALEAPVDLEELDDLVLQATSRSWQGPTGLCHGLAGLAIYGRLRIHDTKGRQIIEHVVLQLHRLAQRSISGLMWPVAASLPHASPGVSLEQGGAGILSALLAIADTGLVHDMTLDLIEGHVPWILDHLGRATSAAWTSGPLGPLCVVLRASTRLRRDDWRTRALDGLERLRPALLEGPIPPNPSVFEGAGGVLVLLQSIGRHLNDPWLRQAHQRWSAAVEHSCLRHLDANAPVDWSLTHGLGGAIRALLEDDEGTDAPWRSLVAGQDLHHA